MQIMSRLKKPKTELQRTFLREWRKYCNLTQEAAASRMDISRSMLAKIENGKTQFTQLTLQAAAEAYGTDMASLLMRDPSKPNFQWDMQPLMIQAEKLPEAKQQHVIEVIKNTIKMAG